MVMVTDRRLLYAAAFVRALATGMAGVLIGIYLARHGLDPAAIGMIVGAGLAGAAAAALATTLGADLWGRRATLLLLALLSMIGGVVISRASTFPVLAIAAFFGMLNGMGRDRGAGLILDQAILPATVDDKGRTRVFAWYNLLQDAGHAAGGLLAALPDIIQRFEPIGRTHALRIAFLVYAGLHLVTVVLYAGLSPAVETERTGPRPALSPESRSILVRISSLFAIDSLAGGFLTTALLSFFFFERFGLSTTSVGVLFFGARVANAFSHLGAAWLAKRIGLVNTMVFTHIPSSLLLVTVAFAPSFPVAAVLFLLREGLVEMDVPTRQSYVMAMVRPEERTVASGVTHLVRLSAWAVAPSFAGILMRGASLGVPLVIGSVMKVSYDLLLYRAFRKLRPPEESGGGAPGPSRPGPSVSGGEEVES
jgi:MFS family permease